MTKQRSTEDVTVTKASESEFTVDAGWTFGNRTLGLAVGDRIQVETINFSRIVGVQNLDTGEWYFRYSDEDIDRQNREQREAIERERREQLAANREDWERRTQALPDWIKPRIETFRRQGGERFEVEGWGYELAIAELAALYAEHGVPKSSLSWEDEPESVRNYAQQHGTSGNQHSFAISLARAHLDGKSVADTVSGLTPITGDPFYTGKE